MEIEQKYADADFATLVRLLNAWGAKAEPTEEHADFYFNAPDRDFAQTGEAFRIRQKGDQGVLTFKGPKRQAAVKTRSELEVHLASGMEEITKGKQLLLQLGYRPVQVVRKKRRAFSLQRGGHELTVCLDEVERVGKFAEVEIIADEREMEAAQALVQRVAQELGLHQVEPRSYLALVLAREGQEPATS